MNMEAKSGRSRTVICDPPKPTWVTHSPTPDNMTEDDDDISTSTRCTSSTPSCTKNENSDKKDSMKNRLKSLFPGIRNKQKRESDFETSGIKILPNGTRVSPPVSPLLEHRNCRESLGSSSESSHKPFLRQIPIDPFDQSIQGESPLTSIHPAEYYAEKVEVYKEKYSYLKSWPGLLRLLAGLQLLIGGMVFACIIAYIHKDSEWTNAYGLYNGVNNNGYSLSGYSYKGPMTPFILVVAGLSWIITLCLLVTGMTMYYRTILLDAPWWPLTEAFINVALFLFYMAAGIVYLNDLNRGGLCYMTIGVNPFMANLCRVDGGQIAGTAFIFINMTMYMGSFLVCLKMWRHEASRKEKQKLREKGEFYQSLSLNSTKTKPSSFKDETQECSGTGDIYRHAPSDTHKTPVSLTKAASSNESPKIHIVADYIIKYPKISCMEEREKYKAVFNDQYQEYKDLHKDIVTTLSRFRELDAMVAQLPRNGKSLEDQRRIRNILKVFHQKKKDPVFIEKKARCNYLKDKLNHIKSRIHIYDQEMASNAQT